MLCHFFVQWEKISSIGLNVGGVCVRETQVFFFFFFKAEVLLVWTMSCPGGSPGPANTQTQLAGNNRMCVCVRACVHTFTFMTDSLPTQCEKNERTQKTLIKKKLRGILSMSPVWLLFIMWCTGWDGEQCPSDPEKVPKDGYNAPGTCTGMTCWHTQLFFSVKRLKIIWIKCSFSAVCLTWESHFVPLSDFSHFTCCQSRNWHSCMQPQFPAQFMLRSHH